MPAELDFGLWLLSKYVEIRLGGALLVGIKGKNPNGGPELNRFHLLTFPSPMPFPLSRGLEFCFG